MKYGVFGFTKYLLAGFKLKKKKKIPEKSTIMSGYHPLQFGSTAILGLLARAFKFISVLRESYRELIDKQKQDVKESALESCDSLRLYS